MRLHRQFMLKPLLCLTLAAAFSLALVACKTKRTESVQPGELSEAEKAERKAKALEWYKRLIEKYPESPHAEQAKERIQQLGGAATAKK